MKSSRMVAGFAFVVSVGVTSLSLANTASLVVGPSYAGESMSAIRPPVAAKTAPGIADVGHGDTNVVARAGATPTEIAVSPLGPSALTVSATLSSEGLALASEPVTFVLAGVSPAAPICSASTDAVGVADCSISPQQSAAIAASGGYVATFVGAPGLLASRSPVSGTSPSS